MAEYYNERSLLQGSATPQFDIGAVTKAGALVQNALGGIRERELEEAKIAKEQKRWDITNARADAQEKRAADEYERQIREKQATNDAVRAAIDPNGYKASKIAGEQKAIEASIANLSPEEQIIARAEIAKNYNPEVSGKQWVDIASNAQGVDVGRVLDTKSRQYEIAAKTPGTPEYIAAEKAKLDLFEREQGITHKNRLAEIGAQTGAQLSYLKAQQDAPQKMVNPTTGETKYVKPSEIDKYPGYMDASTYTATLTDKRERDEKDRKFKFDVSQAVNKTKGELAETLQEYDDESKNAVITSTSDANAIIQEFNKGSGKNIKGLSNADINALVKRSKALNLPFTRSDLNTDLFRQALASEISQKTGQPVEDILKRLEGIEPSKPVVPTTKTNNRSILVPDYGLQD